MRFLGKWFFLGGILITLLSGCKEVAQNHSGQRKKFNFTSGDFTSNERVPIETFTPSLLTSSRSSSVYSGRRSLFSCETPFNDPNSATAWHLDALNLPEKFTPSSAEVFIGVSDSGLDISHLDLQQNTIPGVDFRRPIGDDSYGTDPTPSPNIARATGDHGTSVAGIIAAQSCNGKGARGVAPLSKVGGINLLAPEVLRNPDLNNFLLFEPKALNFKIINQSWGFNVNQWIGEDSSYVNQVIHQVTSAEPQRIFVKAAGNSFPKDAAYDPDQRHPYSILVGALNEFGLAASYSSPGANLWVTAPSAEREPVTGIYTTQATAYKECLNADCYNGNFNGTSAAAPMVTGVIALMLEKKPDLSWRDIKYILAKTATKIDGSSKTWVTNKKGFHFSRDYGFGLVDAKAAVELAGSESFESKDWGPFQEHSLGSKAPSLPIPDNQATGMSDKISASQNLTIEAIELTLNISHRFPSDLHITLTSPLGTKAVVLEPHPGFFTRRPNMPNIRFIVNHFYGETVTGEWKLDIADRWAEDAGVLNSWSLKAYGHVSVPNE